MQRKPDVVDLDGEFLYSKAQGIKGFNIGSKRISPITTAAFEACSSNPEMGCSISTSFKCNKKPYGYKAITPTVRVDDPIASTFCGDSDSCDGDLNGLFVHYHLVNTTSSDASPKCMVLLGPNVQDGVLDPSYDQCSLFFDFYQYLGYNDEYGYGASTIDMNCNQSTRALMCSLIGN